MEPTRRLWILAALGVTSAVLGILFADRLWLGVPLGIGGWLLAEQLVFTQALTTISNEAPIQQTLDHETVLVDESTTLTIADTTADDETRTLSGQLTIRSPPAVTLEDGDEYEFPLSQSQLFVDIRPTVAGTYTIPAPSVTVESHRGLFKETIPVGESCSVTAEPRVPRDIHIGTGGERIAVAAGEHDAAQGGSGFEPGELREYLPGDPTNRIDWNATARLGEPYVREYEAESTRQTHLVVDCRRSMQAGPQGLTKLDHAREIGLWLTDYVARLSDPYAITCIGDEDITGSPPAASTSTQYRRIRRTILDLAAHQSPDDDRENHQQPGSPVRTHQEAQTIAESLTDDSAFAETLRPYFEESTAYLEQVTTDPLFDAIENRVSSSSGDSWVVVITDDANRAELVEAVQFATARDIHVSVFLLPSILFDRTAFADLDSAYGAYREFEEYRQQLAAYPQVTAFEVGPRDRLAALLSKAPTTEAQA